jgi:mono/diheme cytochrome c family protein
VSLFFALCSVVAAVPAPTHQACPTPRPAQWAAIRDESWPLIEHRAGDSAWAHLDPIGLPGASATWCNPLQGDSEAVRAGRSLFVTWCASCHGELGKGDGLGAAQQDPPPYDFTRAEFAGMREPPGPAVLYAILTRGIPVTGMRAFANDLGGWERLAVIAYVTQLPGPTALRASRAWADSLRARKRP